MANKWHYQAMGATVGPVSSEELMRLAREGVLRPDSLVRPDAAPNQWSSAEHVKGLFASKDHKICPFCAELVSREAKKCKHCLEFFRQEDKNEMLPRPDAQIGERGIICPNMNCGFVGYPIKTPRANLLPGILLMILFVVPGLLYFIFNSGFIVTCPKCGIQIRFDRSD